jgi:putative PIN family toxin of toxin-antitoxin system
MIVVLDTNIVVSALLFNGPASAAHKAWCEGTIELLFTPEILAEYRSVFSYPKFQLTENDVAYLIEEEILPFGQPIEIPPATASWIPEDPDDDLFIEAAIHGNAEALVSGDGHILSNRGRLPCKVLTLAELFEKLK